MGVENEGKLVGVMYTDLIRQIGNTVLGMFVFRVTSGTSALR